MENHVHKTRSVCCALIVLLCFFTASVSSENFIGTHANHDCPGEGCPVCLQLQWAWNFSGQLRNASFQPFLFTHLISCIVLISGYAFFDRIRLTAVGLKVRMNR
jgi:hypothetical protein